MVLRFAWFWMLWVCCRIWCFGVWMFFVVFLGFWLFLGICVFGCLFLVGLGIFDCGLVRYSELVFGFGCLFALFVVLILVCVFWVFVLLVWGFGFWVFCFGWLFLRIAV